MPIIQLSLTQKEYDYLDMEARNKKIDIPILIKEKVFPKSEIDELLNKLIKEINLKQKGDIFTVRDIFGNRWKDIERGTRLSLGRTFNKKVIHGAIENVEVLPYKDSSSTQLYRKL